MFGEPDQSSGQKIGKSFDCEIRYYVEFQFTSACITRVALMRHCKERERRIRNINPKSLAHHQISTGGFLPVATYL